MGKFLTKEAVDWSIRSLGGLPKNQTALFYFFIVTRCPTIDRTHEMGRKEFEREFYRYFGAPIKGGGIGVYDPFGKEWRAENYINSTVYGRLLVGSHRWTEGEESFFERRPAGSGWPATFVLTDKGFDNLRFRNSPPCLSYDYRLPLSSVSLYFYRFDDLKKYNPTSLEDVVSIFQREVLSLDKRLSALFVKGNSFMGKLFRDTPLSEEERISCYPFAPHSSEPKSRELLYKSDIEYIESRLDDGETVAEYIHKMIRQGRL